MSSDPVDVSSTATVAPSGDLLIERLLRVIDEGRRTATYKLALLLGLIEAAAESPGATELPTRLIAERVLSLYFPQTRAYVDGTGTTRAPRQISMKGSPVLGAVERLRERAQSRGTCRTAADARRLVPDDYERTVEAVEATFVRYPIPLLQVVGGAIVPFLYEVDWPEGTSVKALRRLGCDRVRLLPGVGDRLVVLGPMLRPLIELHWTRDVARWSRVPLEDERLRAHLFGTNRVAFPSELVESLREVQGGDCFYCGERLVGRPEVDHFLAWSRWPNDAIENLVLADRCNGAKRDHLAATAHLARWRLRLETGSEDLRRIATDQRWPTDRSRSWALVRATYAHISAGTPLWRIGREFELASGPVLV